MATGIFTTNEIADTARVAREIAQALEQRRPCSLISMADGESATLWAGRGFQTFNYLAGRGIPRDEFEATAAQLAAAIARTDIVCVPRSGNLAKQPLFWPKLREAMALWDVHLKPTALLGDALVCFYLMFDMWLWGLVENRRVLVVNDEADKVVNALLTKTVPGNMRDFAPPDRIRVSGADAIMLQEGLTGSQKALDQAAALPIKPDIALLGAGARAAHISVELAEMHSIPVIELGCVCTLFHQEASVQSWQEWLTLYQAEG